LQSPMGISWEVPFIFIDKNSLKAINIQLKDDIFHLFPDTFFGKNLNWSDGRKPFQGNLMYTVVNADELTEMLQNRTGELGPEIEIEIEKLRYLKEDDNPVVFQFTLRSSIKDF